MAPKDLNFITGNKNKLLEVKTILAGTVNLTSQSLDLDEIQGTIEEIVTDKCKRAAAAVRGQRGNAFAFCCFLILKQVNGPVLVEDTSLCFTALKELPGPYM